MRHAPSAELAGVKDHELPITQEGQELAKRVAEEMKSLGWIPNIVMSSNSVRSRQTFEVMKSVIEELSHADLHFLGSLYTESQLDGHTLPFLARILAVEASEEDECVLCLGHNKGWEEAASILAVSCSCCFEMCYNASSRVDFYILFAQMESIQLDHCDAALFEAAGDSWAELLNAENFEQWSCEQLIRADSKAL
jgi:phosphohistidine phosphatase SixA